MNRTGPRHMAARRAANAGMRALQIFTAIPKYYGDKSTIKPERVARFRETLAQTPIRLDKVMVHAAYVLNTATPDEGKWVRARDGLAKELERSTALGVYGVCFHPGAATDDDRDAAAARVAAAMLYALDHHVARLADDHARAKRLAAGIGIDPDEVETNFVAIADPGGDGIDRAAAAGVALGDLRPGWLRAVTHLDVTDDDVDAAVDALGAGVTMG